MPHVADTDGDHGHHWKDPSIPIDVIASNYIKQQ